MQDSIMENLINSNMNHNYHNLTLKFLGSWNWEKNDEYSVFTIDIRKIDGKTLGQICFVTEQGQKVDCAIDSDFSFEIVDTNSNLIQVTFKSNYSNSEGKASLELLTEGRLKWKILKEPEGEYYCPKEALLEK